MESPRKREAGFTIVEVLVAILILAIGAMTTFALLSAATRNAQRAKGTQVALEFAEQELEFLRSLENKQLALTATPPHVSSTSNPDYRVSDGVAAPEPSFALTRRPVGNYREMVVNGRKLFGGAEIKGGVVSPGPTPFTNGDVTGKVYRYIVWHNDESCAETACPGKQDYKQIVVAVRLDPTPGQPYERGYVEVQSNFIDPTDSAKNDPVPGNGGKVITAQQFFLSDTPCSATGVTGRQEAAGDHPLHNTRGACVNGPQTGSTKGAPDALLLGGPPDPSPADPNDPPLYDYSNDLYLDKGLQINKDEVIGCNYEPGGTANLAARTHRWVTDPMKEAFVMTEKATLEVFVRALAEQSYTGTICVYLFKRHESGSTFTDSFLQNTIGGTRYWKYTPENNVPFTSAWSSVRLLMPFTETPYTIPAGDRLGLAFGVERNNTQGSALAFMYDNPGFAARLEVTTNTPIGGG